MANIVWNGSTGNLATPGNWVGGVAPGASDVAVFNRGSQDVDPSLGNIPALDGIEIQPGYGENEPVAIGGSGNKMTSSVNTVRHTGSAEFWFDDSAALTDDVFIRCLDRNVVVNLGGDTMTNVTILRGNVTLDGTTGVIALLAIGFVASVQQDVTLNIVTNANAITAAKMWGGDVTLNKTITTLDIANGLIKLPTGTSGSITQLYQLGGGVIRHNTLTTIALAYASGTLDLGREAKTVTKLIESPGANVIDNDVLHTITKRFNLAEVD